MADDLTLEDLNLDETQEVSIGSENLLNEDGELNEGAFASEEDKPSASKVELDLDDAPFLQEEPKEEPAPAPAETSEAPVVLEKEKEKLTRLQKILRLFKNKKILYINIKKYINLDFLI